MFKNTNHFFKKVFNDSVSQIDQDNYVNAITDNHNLEKLKTLYSDLEVFVFFQNDMLESEIDSLQIKNKIEHYQKEGKEVPYATHKNIEYEIAKRKKSSLEGIPETKQILDLEKMFYQLEMYTIRRLKHNIGSLIKETKKQELEKESNIKVTAPKDIDSRSLTANQRALIMVYNGNTMVTRNEHGDDLYNKVTKWVKSKTRTADPDTTKLVLENKIKLFESIIPFLLEENRQKAIDEIKTLKLHLLKY